MAESPRSLTSGRRLLRSAAWNLAGLVAPLGVALVAIPLLIDGMGKERFGLLAIIWMGVGYFSLFDMGLGRALTKLVAERLGHDRVDDLGPLIWTALALVFALGSVGAMVLVLAAPALVLHVFKVEPGMHAEAITAFRVLGFGLPVVVITTAFVGLLEAHQRFASIAAVRIPLGVLTFGGPLLTLQFTPSLVWATAALLLARMVAAGAFAVAAAGARPELKRVLRPARRHVGPLFRFGGWLTVTNVVGPLMVYFDRFFIGSILTMTAVTYYVTPYEVLSRAQLLSQSAMAVLFPALSTALVSDRERLKGLYRRASRLLFVVMLPVAALFFLFAAEALSLWLDESFVQRSAPVVQWLAVGLLLNTLARSPFTVLQSAGRPDLAAKAHVAELVPYAALLVALTMQFGIAGTAAAWCLRMLADALIMNTLARRCVPELAAPVQEAYMAMLLVGCAFPLAWLVEPLAWRIGLWVAVSFGALVALLPLLGGPFAVNRDGATPREDAGA